MHKHKGGVNNNNCLYTVVFGIGTLAANFPKPLVREA